jgi:hypothetical protein
MDYTYLFEDKVTPNRDLPFDNIVNETNSNIGILYILCYHINNQNKYPFLQFMMKKIPYCNDIVKEELTLPYIFFRDIKENVEERVLHIVKSGLKSIGCEYEQVTKNMYKGILFGTDRVSSYAFVNITGIDITGLNLQRNYKYWFVLPSEIINTKNVCNIDIDGDVTQLFANIPQLGYLVNRETNNNYILPDAVYTGSEIKLTEFQSVFGNTKKKIYQSCDKYYFFNRTFSNAVKDGGWLSTGSPNKIGDRLLVDSNSNKYISGGINRYALFVEGKIYLEPEKKFTLTDTIIENVYPEPCLIICYSGEHYVNPDMLVKDYEIFSSLSYHKLDKRTLEEHFVEKDKDQYMIQ